MCPSWQRSEVDARPEHQIVAAGVSGGGSDGRKSPRVEGRFPATLIDEAGRDYPVIIRDLSSTGFRLECSENLSVGERVALRVSRYADFPAEIRWALGNEAGGVFLEPVPLP